jgi:uncharacterized protein YjdB
MKKAAKFLSVVLSVLMLTMVLPFAAFAGSETQDIDGNSTVSNVIIKVTVPANLDFALDPLELSVQTGNQIKTTDYFFINKTVAPVKVAVNLTATLAVGGEGTADDVTLVSSPATLKPYDTEVTSKQIYFGMLGATGIKDDDVFDFSDVPGAEGSPIGEYDTSKAALITAFDTTTKTASIAFALAKAADLIDAGDTAATDPLTGEAGSDGYGDALAAANAGVASFQFYGKMNTYAAWVANDVTIGGSYTLTPLSATTYSNYTTNGDYITDGLNQIIVPVALTALTVTGAGGATSVVNGQTLQMAAAPTPTGATDPSVTWSVAGVTGTATISEAGLLTATGVGTVDVTATSKANAEITNTLRITVTAEPVPLTGLTVTGAGGATTVGVEGTLQMNAALVPANSTSDPTVTWSVDDTDVATIDEDTGVLTGVAFGTVTVTATSVEDTDISGTTTITVTFTDPGFISGTDTVQVYAGAQINSSKASATNISIPFFFKGLTISKLELTTGAVYALPAGEYTISGDNLVLVKTSSTCTLRTISTTGAKSFTLTLSDNSTYTFTVNVTA